MQAIITKYLSPTNFRGTRIKATASAGSVVMGYKYNLNIDGNHAAAAEALIAKFGWDTNRDYSGFVTGQLPNGDYAHVMMRNWREWINERPL